MKSFFCVAQGRRRKIKEPRTQEIKEEPRPISEPALDGIQSDRQMFGSSAYEFLKKRFPNAMILHTNF